MREAWGVMMACALASCGGAPVEPDAGDETVCTPGESRACTCSSGASGAQVCTDDGRRLGPCTCAELDAGLVEEDAGVTRDGGHDGGVDASTVTDGGPRDAGPPWGECWLAPQAGCEAGEACRHSTPDEPPFTSPPTGPPECQPAGTLDDWRTPAPCSRVEDGELVDLCAAGLFCDQDVCRRYCDPEGAPCPALPDGRERVCVALDFPTGAVIHYCGLR